MARESARVVVNAVDNASAVLRGVGKSAGAMGDALDRSLRVAANFTIATMGVVRATRALGEALATPIQLAAEQQRVEQQLAAVLESTEHAAGLQKDALLEMASAYQEVTKFGDEAIIGAQNILLTFTNIGGAGGIFERTTGVVLDVAEAMGSSLKEASIQLGKALNDPITGVSALGEVGITFSQQQKEVIKSLAETGRLAEAQTLILDELERQFGGSATAAAETFGGALTQLDNAWGDLLETAGAFIVENEGVVALFNELTAGVADLNEELSIAVESEEAQIRAAKLMQDAMVGVIGAVQGTSLALAGFAEHIGEVFLKLNDTVAAIPVVGDGLRGLEDRLRPLRRELEEAEARWNELHAAHRRMIDSGTATRAELVAAAEAVREAKAEAQRLGVEYAAASNTQLDFTSGVKAMNAELEQLKERLRAVDVEAAIEGDFFEQLPLYTEAVEGLTGALEAFREAAALAQSSQAGLGAELSDQRLQVEALLGELVGAQGAFNAWSERWRALREDLVGMPWEQQIDRMEAFEEALRSQVEQSKEYREAMQGAGGAATELAEESERAGERMQESFGERFKEVLDGLKDEYDELVAAQKRAEEEWERSVENMASRASDAFGSVLDDWADGQQSLRDGFQKFGGSARDVLTDAFLGPITDADSALHEVFSSAISPVKALGQAVNDELIAPLIGGVIEFFTQKTAAEQAAAAASTGIHSGQAAATVTIQQASVAAMMPGLSAAATAALIATFGGAAAAAGLLPEILASSAAFGEAFGQAMQVPLAEGGFITQRTPAIVGEAGPELVLPLSRPARARELLSELPARAPHLAGGGGTVVNVPVSLTVMNGSNLDERDLAERVADIVNERLGRELRI